MWETIAAIAGPAILGGLSGFFGGDEEGSSTETQERMPWYAQEGTRKLWDSFIDALYPSANPSYILGSDKERIWNRYKQCASAGEDMRHYPELYDFMTRHNFSVGYTSEDVVKALDSDPTLSGGVSATSTAKSYEDYLSEDYDYRKAATDEFLYGSETETGKYTKALQDAIKGIDEGTGLYTPTNFSVGGKKVASIVPKSNMSLAGQKLGYQKDSTAANLALLADKLKAKETYTPNGAKTQYIEDTLIPLVTNLVPQTQATQTKTVKTDSNPWEDALTEAIKGATAGINIAKNWWE